MSISPRKPSDNMLSFRDAMNRLFDPRYYWPTSAAAWWTGAGTVLLDAYEEDGNLVVKAALPDMKPEDVNIEVRDNLLIISGDTKQEEERKDIDYFLREQSYGHIERSMVLPYEVNLEKANAEFEKGRLTITLPKAKPVKTTKIPLKSKEKA